MIIEKASQHLTQWVRLRTLLWPDLSIQESQAEVPALLQDPRQEAFVVLQGSECLGFIEVSLRAYAEGCESSPVGYIEGWYVQPQQQGRGYGRALVQAAEAWAKAQGCSEMASDSLLDNLQGQTAHLALGYQEVERVVLFRKDL